MIFITRCIIELQSPLHCGGGTDTFLDQPLVRDAFGDQPVIRDAFGIYRIPGSSLAGILRAEVTRLYPEEDVNAAFGIAVSGQSSVGDAASLIWCSDGRALDFDMTPASEKSMRGDSPDLPQGPFVRDHVRIDMERGCAEDGGKFDEEYVPAGTRFALEFSLDGRHSEPGAGLTALFMDLCAFLKTGRLRLGAHAAEGFGRIAVLSMMCRHFDLASEQGMTQWLNLSAGPMFLEGEGAEIPIPDAPRRVAAVSGISGEVRLNFTTDGPILIGGGLPAAGGDDKAPDMIFVTEPYCDYERKPEPAVIRRRIIPGSSFRGVMRHRVYRIARALGATEQEGEAIVNGLFGQAEAGASGQPRPGKLQFTDAELRDAACVTVQHVAIDRFTGGALDGALYSEAPVWRAGLAVPFALYGERLELWEAALIAHALLDMAEGRLPVGAGGNRGNGFLRLHAPVGAWNSLEQQGTALDLSDPQVLHHWMDTLDASLASQIWRRV